MAKRRKRRSLLRIASIALVLAALAYVGLLAAIWSSRVELSVQSAALGESRAVTLFNWTAGSPEVAIYALDGDKARNGLLPAAHATVIAALRGEPRPLVVAIHDHGGRDRDFRPPVVRPAPWRPNVSGRGPSFDVFLIRDVRRVVEARFGAPRERWLFGHSLAGFYALDMASRRAAHGFSAIHAFSPTFSHDLSLLGRLDKACGSTPRLYANIGIESRRDTEVFDRAERTFSAARACRGKVTLSRHYGIVHPLIMLTGQIEALLGRRLLREG